ncbi:MAG: HD domain-containing phosphohydrolase [Spirochaetota bacterium]
MEKPTILVVDDEPNNIKLLNQILQKEYKTRIATNGSEALKRAMIEPFPELILLDIMMPEMDGYEVCRRLKAEPSVCKVPIIFVTAKGEVEDETFGFEVGAVDYIQKPISGPIVLARVAAQLVLANMQRVCESKVVEQTVEIFETQKSAIYMLGEAGHYNDTDTGTHIWRMAAYSRAIAQAANWPVDQAKLLELAAPMHDTGKIGIPDAVLKKPARLDPAEWQIMKEHAAIGHNILSKSHSAVFAMAADIALYHHEKWDGSGYPKGLKGEEIPQRARIVAIADVFDALTMKRPYKEPWSIDDSMAEIEKQAGSHFDPNLVGLFFSIESKIREIEKEWRAKE